MSTAIINGLFVLGGAALGAVLTALFVAYQSNKNQTRSEVSIQTGVATRLVEVDSSISEIIEISIQGRIVPAVYTLDTRVTNTGTEEILAGDVDVALGGDSRVLAVDLVECPRGALEAVRLETQDAGAGFRFRFEYMNEGETFLIRSLLSGRPSSVVPTFRKPGVNVRTSSTADPSVPVTIGRALLLALSSALSAQPLFVLQLGRNANKK